MNILPNVEIIFVVIGLIFLVIAFNDYKKSEKSWTIGAKIRLRMGIIFTAVGIGLYILHTYIWK